MAKIRSELFTLFAEHAVNEIDEKSYSARLLQIVERDEEESNRVISATLNRRIASVIRDRANDVLIWSVFEVEDNSTDVGMHISVAVLPEEEEDTTKLFTVISATIREVLQSLGLDGKIQSLTVNGEE